ncbi:DUF885 family protein [Hymenobacter sp. PAMC 26628]|uniref:DUF885 family protein n=1 Tax=Hymenobacter sp. PAMC 26628 TaxID=1484118 RepID=UPI0007705BA9|nr:DUF885 family protein [Hymenobacter sp. PAMC 26628]AMJ64217.1 hypothetical protein AXW84_01285 [Hymenobacter sp. PAMC 26628]
MRATGPGRHRLHPDARFDTYKNQFLLALWRQEPGLATTKGYHKYDSLLVIPDAAQRQRDATFAKKNLTTLGTFDLARLSPANQIDLRLLRNELRARRWYADTLREWQWNPATYNLGSAVAPLLNGRYYRLDRRLRNISDKISHAAAYYAAAKANISTPAKEHTELALQQLAGGLAVFGPTLADSVQQSGLSAAEKQAFMARVAATRQAMQGYLDFLKNEVLPAGKFRSFRIGKALFDQKFAYDIQSPFPAEAVYRPQNRPAARHGPAGCPALPHVPARPEGPRRHVGPDCGRPRPAQPEARRTLRYCDKKQEIGQVFYLWNS